MDVRTPIAPGLEMLRRIGEGLDRDLYPVVRDGGVVEPGTPRSLQTIPGKERRNHAGEGQGGSATGPRQGAPGWSGSAHGPAAEADPAAPLIRGLDPVGHCAQEMPGVPEAYPQVGFRHTPGITWLDLVIRPIEALSDTAFITTAVPEEAGRRVQSWAWWTIGVWIGPRHTNHPDGSICAYEAGDRTWTRGDSLVILLDLTTLWVVRHLHLRHFDRWPGRQVLHTAHERRTEHRPGELCGGCASGRRYELCCQPRDLLQSHAPRRREEERFRGAVRRPPTVLVDWLFRNGRAPDVDLVCPHTPGASDSRWAPLMR